MFDRILIANRGEIARRIIRTCKRLGIETVGVYSDADASAPHVAEATFSCNIGPEAPSLSYLNHDAIIEAALCSGARAIHPGYGFLSENAQFAAMVASAGLKFIGPDASVIEMMGDKARAKSLMQSAGVPTIPGSSDATSDLDKIARLVDQIGLPALLKPVAGGGGKGMRVLRPGDNVREAAAAACRVAASSFGDSRMLVESYVEKPRHIEVQVFGDSFGNVVHLFERECSLQRRHQKIIEEAPAPHLDPEVRDLMLTAAVEGARSIGYTNAGTFEFILSDNAKFYFLEVNTRLQVEHPVTEAITGLDLVEWQLRVAAGEALPLEQDEIPSRGHAIEARVYAEDPEADFRPAPGRVDHVLWPEGLRVDSAIVARSHIAAAYDPMVAKVVAQGCERSEALSRLRSGLANSLILGSPTNLGYLGALLGHPDVIEGRLDTGLVERAGTLATSPEIDQLALAAYAAVQLQRVSPHPWYATSGDRGLHRSTLITEAPLGVVTAEVAGRIGEAFVVGAESDAWLLSIDKSSLRANASWDDHLWSGWVDGCRWWGAFVSGDMMSIQIAGFARMISPPSFHAPDVTEGLSGIAPLAGVLSTIDVKEGDVVSKGDRLVVVEAMKMELPVLAPASGIVDKIACQQGDNVVAEQILVRLRPAAVEDDSK